MEILFKLAFKLTAGFLGGWGNPGLWTAARSLRDVLLWESPLVIGCCLAPWDVTTHLKLVSLRGFRRWRFLQSRSVGEFWVPLAWCCERFVARLNDGERAKDWVREQASKQPSLCPVGPSHGDWSNQIVPVGWSHTPFTVPLWTQINLILNLSREKHFWKFD